MVEQRQKTRELRDEKPDQPLLEVRNLKTYFDTRHGMVTAVDGVNVTVKRGEILGLVGESGCGKSVTSLSIMRLVRRPGEIVGGRITFDGTSLLDLPLSEMFKIRGNRISMIFQQPLSSLNPSYKVGDQIAETLHIHRGMSKDASWQRAIEVIRSVGIPDAERRAHAYPHELSGGMAQRVMIAMALACEPELLIADEPTTALDVTIQAQILDLLRGIRSRLNASIILITHDMGIIAETADRVAVMYAGRIVEEAPVGELFARPQHPYTQGLLGSIPVLGQVKGRLEVIPGSVPSLIGLPPGCKFAPRCQARIEHELAVCTQLEPTLRSSGPGHNVKCWLYHDSDYHKAPLAGISASAKAAMTVTPRQIAGGEPVPTIAPGSGAGNRANGQRPLVTVENLVKHFSVRSGFLQQSQPTIKAVDGVSFTIYEGETLGLVGESGCGKTTVGRTVLRLVQASSGRVIFDNRNIFDLGKRALKNLRRDMQLIFQDPISSLDPRMRVGESIGEGLRVHGLGSARQRREIVLDMLDKVGLEPYHANRFPHEFSGGQRQRIGIARALALQPRFIVCDEPVSALDVSIQSQVLNLLRDLQREFNLTYLFIAHDLSVVEHISERVAVMYLGKIVELAARSELYYRPLHPYTQALLSAIPVPDPGAKRERVVLQGEVPSPQNPPSGCRFHTRCPYATDVCREVEPEFRNLGTADNQHWVACHHAERFS